MTPNKKKEIDFLVVTGPTATGKTKVAVDIASKYSGEIISADSRQIYKNMGIGTAQPTIVEQDGIEHHLIGIKSPTEEISAGAYSKLVYNLVEDIFSRNHIPILCGGSGLYYRAITRGIFKESKTDLKMCFANSSAIFRDLDKQICILLKYIQPIGLV